MPVAQPTTCAHDWVRFTNIPPGQCWPFWQCSLCGTIGYTRSNGYGNKDKAHRRVRTLVCHRRGCSAPAVDRLPGYHCANKLRWVCMAHRDTTSSHPC